jgi:condensin complex subunit 1
VEEHSLQNTGEIAPQMFRDTFSIHVYMLYSFMFLLESDAKGNSKNLDEILQMRQIASTAMVRAAETMAECRKTFWRMGVPDEVLLLLPCRIAYPMLELSTGVMARKAVCGDQALRMIAVTIKANECTLSNVTAALMDLMHSFDHMASLAALLCSMVSDVPINRLAVELIREIGRLDCLDGKALGIKNVAPFISELASIKPRIVLSNISYVLRHLNSEPHNLRVSIVTAISYILEDLAKTGVDKCNENSQISSAEDMSAPGHGKKSVESLYKVLIERVHDSSSYTRAATMKAWIRLTENKTIPRDKVTIVTKLAMDRLQDKTVLVRKQAMQVRVRLAGNIYKTGV